MTKELAIEWLKSLNYCDGEETQEVAQAIEIAIKALEQQPCEDCVSRKQLLEKTVKKNGIWNKITNSKGENLEEIITKLPTVTPAQSWTPIEVREPTQEEKEEYLKVNGEELCYMVDSRMPEDGQEVLVSHGGYVTTDVFLEEFWNFENLDIENVEAWMPLPQPYEDK